MRRLLASCAALLAVACARPASAQVAGQFGDAVPLVVNAHVMGVYAGLAQHQAEAVAQLRQSFHPGMDFGFQGGLHRFDVGSSSRTAVEVGGDLRAQVARRASGAPCDMALGGAIQLSNADHRNTLAVGPTFAASRTYALSRGQFSPYAGVALLYARSDLGATTETDLSLPLRMGFDFRPNPGVGLVLELQIPISDPGGTHPKVFLGANFPF